MEKEKHIYELRKDGNTICQSPIPFLGYRKPQLRQIVNDGYKYYVDGKYQRKVE